MAGSVAKLVFKELQAINRKSLFDDTAVIQPIEEDNPLRLCAILTPQAGYYKGGSFEFLLEIPDTYPSKPPKVTCKSKVYHPNIAYKTGAVCLSMLSEPNSNYQIEHYINGLLYLFHHPNIESRLNSEVTHDPRKFPLLVRDSLMGKRVGSMNFPTSITHQLSSEDHMEMLLAGLEREALVGLEFPLARLVNFVGAQPIFKEKLWSLFPPLEVALEKGFEISFSKVLSSGTSVAQRSAALRIPKNQVIKEMVILVDEKPHLFLTNGPNLVNVEALSKILGKSVRVSKAKEAKRMIDERSFASFSIFQRGSPPLPIMYNDSILKEDSVITAAGLSKTVMRIRSKELIQLLPTDAQLVVDAVIQPLAGPSPSPFEPLEASALASSSLVSSSKAAPSQGSHPLEEPSSESAAPSSSSLQSSAGAASEFFDEPRPSPSAELKLVQTSIQALDISAS